MRKTIVLVGMIVFFFVIPFGQTIDELLSLANNISNLKYVQSLSAITGISGWRTDLGGSLSLPLSISGTATAEMTISQSLKFGMKVSNNEVGFFATFEPFAYQRAVNKILYDHLNEKTKLKIKIIELFFNAFQDSRTITQLSSDGTSLKNETEIELLKSKYTYDIQMINAILGTQISALTFPALNIPKIPKRYTPVFLPKLQSNNSNFSLGGSVDFMSQTKHLKFGISLNYSWNSPIKKESKSFLNVVREKYFRDIHILSQSVRIYDNELSKLFDLYSKIYGEYLNGKNSLKDVKDISKQISSLGYERDMYCIKLIEEFYLYKAIGV